MPTLPPADPDLEEAIEDREAFLRTAAARAALPLADAPPCRLDAGFAARRALTAAAAAAKHRAVLARLETYEVARLDALPDLARAFRFVDRELRRREQAPPPEPELLAEAEDLRGLLLSFADVLARIGRVEADLVAEVRAASGDGDLAEDLRVLGAALLAQPAAVVGEATLVTRAQAERAAALAVALGAETDSAVPASARRLRAERNRLGALLVQAWREVRRGVDFLRFHHGDADELAPALHRGGRKPGSAAGSAPRETAPRERWRPADPEDYPFTDDE